MGAKSLRGRVLIALIFSSLVPLLAVAYQGYHCGRMAVMDLLELHAASIAESHRAALVSQIEERKHDLAAFGRSPLLLAQVQDLLRSGNPDAAGIMEAMLKSEFDAQTLFDTAAILDLNWNRLAALHEEASGLSGQLNGELRQRIASTDAVAAVMTQGKDTTKAFVYAGAQIRDENGAPIAYVAARLDLSASLLPVHQGGNGYREPGKAYLVQQDAANASIPLNANGTAHSPVLEPPQAGAIDRKSAGSAQEVARASMASMNQSVIRAESPLPWQGWALAVEVNGDEAMSWVDTLLLRAMLMVGVSLGVIVVLSTWLSGLLGKPLAHLAAVAHRISGGHTEERLGPMPMLEAEEVRRAFNHMLDELRSKETEIVRTATLATVGELTSSVVHEMRNPLSSIKMNVQALGRVLPGDSADAELAAIAGMQILRLEGMLNELLQYGRPLVLRPEPAAVDLIIDKAVESVQEAAASRDVRVTFENAMKGCILPVDVEQLTRALSNLLRNAAEASPEGGEVHVSVTRGGAHSGECCMAIADSGSGIRPEHLDRLFKPFFTTKHNGTGLGLANVLKIVQLHGGAVAARNRAEGGAVFTVHLPLDRAPGSSQP
ncbi:MAG: sensor histidine kinase [Candidatus Hydrogenedentes bacterium]|nr:sensor histidine kinase [Candidatus Hydrogenedentota bacterium]